MTIEGTKIFINSNKFFFFFFGVYIKDTVKQRKAKQNENDMFNPVRCPPLEYEPENLPQNKMSFSNN